RTDSAPYSGARKSYDVGAAVYFSLNKKPYCLPCDRWNRLPDNLAAIAAHLEAMRGMDRWGVGSIEQAFAGYKALPARGETADDPGREAGRLGRRDQAGLPQARAPMPSRQGRGAGAVGQDR